MKKLNLGCGRFKKEGFLNVDWDETVQPDLVHDLSILPYPFEDNSFEHVEMSHVLEHLASPFPILKELHRISTPEGLCIIRVPHFSRAMSHPEHQHGFDYTFPLYFNPNFQGGYSGTHWVLEGMKLTWSAQPYLKKQLLPRPAFLLAQGAGWIIDRLANLSPMLCSRIWCFWVGGFEEIEFRFRCRKDEV